jgi:hypothetical protein
VWGDWLAGWWGQAGLGGLPACPPACPPGLVRGTVGEGMVTCPPLQRKGQTVLVTAAAGGTGQLAVPMAVLAGCHVIGICSGGSKAELLR